MGSGPPSESRAKVLVVDDDEVQLAVLRAWIESIGFQVLTHNGPLGTLSILFREQPDIVILDIGMPGLSGDALGKLIAQQQADARKKAGIIFYSGKDPATVRAMTRDFSVLGAIQKTDDGALFLQQFQRIVSSNSPSPTRRSVRP